MKKIIVSILAATCALSSLAAFTWSGLIDNNTKFSANNDFSALGLNQSNGIYLSAASKLNESGTLRFNAEGLYKYYLNCDLKEGESTFKNIVDLDLLKLTGEFSVGNGVLGLSAGRFQYSDYSGAVFSQVSDGLYLNYNTQKIKVSLYGGYTGLLNRLNVSMIENEYEEDENFYALCPKYVPVTADFAYKALLGSNTIGLQAAGFIPVTDDNTLKGYGTLILNGYLGKVGLYDARVTAGTEKFENLMLDAKLDLNFFIGKVAMATVGGEYVSGDQGPFDPFVTITARSFGSAPFYNGGIIPKAGITFASNQLLASLTERVVIAMPADEANLDGFDTSVNVTYKLFSDVVIGCDIGAYICTEVEEKSNYYATVKASLAF